MNCFVQFTAPAPAHREPNNTVLNCRYDDDIIKALFHFLKIYFRRNCLQYKTPLSFIYVLLAVPQWIIQVCEQGLFLVEANYFIARKPGMFSVLSNRDTIIPATLTEQNFTASLYGR